MSIQAVLAIPLPDNRNDRRRRIHLATPKSESSAVLAIVISDNGRTRKLGFREAEFCVRPLARFSQEKPSRV